MTSDRSVVVHIQLPGLREVVPAARLRVQVLPDGQRIGRFRYGDRYLERPNAVALDPFQLPLSAQEFAFTRFGGLPGAVRDASPDAWGRLVIEHRLQRTSADLDEIDYLLEGPQDGAGDLSFSEDTTPPARDRPYNRTYQLADSIAATQAIESGQPVPPDLLDRLNPGTSLGGARPKATIEDEQGLWLGKFPSRDDRFNLQRVECATLDLAKLAGLDVAEAKLEKVGESDVLMVKRFDRVREGEGYIRWGLVSAMTVLDCGDTHTDRGLWSYPLLADQLRRWSARPVEDAAELFRRVAFNALVTNNDDHPRNHALIRTAAGWRLSLAYDLVPTPLVSQERRDLAMTVGRFGRTASRYNLLSQAEHFGLSQEEAQKTINHVVGAVRGWRECFQARGVSIADIDVVARAFLPDSFFLDQPRETF